jgi:hypothetical protein
MRNAHLIFSRSITCLLIGMFRTISREGRLSELPSVPNIDEKESVAKITEQGGRENHRERSKMAAAFVSSSPDPEVVAAAQRCEFSVADKKYRRATGQSEPYCGGSAFTRPCTSGGRSGRPQEKRILSETGPEATAESIGRREREAAPSESEVAGRVRESPRSYRRSKATRPNPLHNCQIVRNRTWRQAFLARTDHRVNWLDLPRD